MFVECVHMVPILYVNDVRRFNGGEIWEMYKLETLFYG